MRPLKRLLGTVSCLLMFAGVLSAQIYELPCIAGSSPLPIGTTYNPSTNKYRAWVCADNTGHVNSPVFSTSGGGVTSVFGRTGAVVANALDYSAVNGLTLGDGASDTIVFNGNGILLTGLDDSTIGIDYEGTAGLEMTGSGGASFALDGLGNLIGVTGSFAGVVELENGVSSAEITLDTSGNVNLLYAGSGAITTGTLIKIKDSTGSSIVSAAGPQLITSVNTGAQTVLSAHTYTMALASFTQLELSDSSPNITSNAPFLAPGYISNGTTFTATGCGTPTSLTGGATAGSFLAQATSCTVVITMGTVSGTAVTAAHGWPCSVWDTTTTADTLKETTTTTTTATFSGTVVVGDKIIFGCGPGF